MKPSHMAVVAIAVGSFWVGTRICHCEEAPWFAVAVPTAVGGLSVFVGGGCAIATVSDDSTVTVDWHCVDESAKAPMRGDITAAYARVLKAVRDGTAVNR